MKLYEKEIGFFYPLQGFNDKPLPQKGTKIIDNGRTLLRPPFPVKNPVVLIFILAQIYGTCLFAQWPPYGEKIRDVASQTLEGLNEKLKNGECQTCSQPTLFGRKQCFKCLQKQAPHDFKEWVFKAYDSAREALEKLRDPKLTDPIIERLLEAKRQFQDSRKMDSEYELAKRRQEIESLGKIPIGPDGKTFNDYSREAIKKYLPALEGMEYTDDPAKTISYFLILDGKGFIENVRCVRGPSGQQMTLLEAYQFYTGTDPKKAKDILEILDNVRKLSTQDCNKESIPLLLDTIARGLRLIQK